MSRVIYSIAWFALYVPLLTALVGLDWRALGSAYLRSAIATVAAIAPMAAALWSWPVGQDPGLFALAGLGLAGVACWLATLFLIRHPAAPDIREMVEAALDRPRRVLRARLGA